METIYAISTEIWVDFHQLGSNQLPRGTCAHRSGSRNCRVRLAVGGRAPYTRRVLVTHSSDHPPIEPGGHPHLRGRAHAHRSPGNRHSAAPAAPAAHPGEGT